MIRLVEWLLGNRRTEEIRAEQEDAANDVTASRVLRHHAEQLGRFQRQQLADNHFGERMAAALEPRGGYPA